MKEHLFKNPSDKFPIISRIITDTVLLSIALTFVLLLSTGVVGYQLFTNIQKKQELIIEQESLKKDQEFWQKISKSHPDYPDAYISLAIISFRTKDFVSAKKYTGEALLIDPTHKQGRYLQSELERLGF